MADNNNSPVNERFTNRIDKDIPDDTEELLKAIQAVGLAEKTMWASISAMKKDGDLQRFREAIKNAGFKTTTPMVICNSDDYKSVKAAAAGEIKAGEQLVEIN